MAADDVTQAHVDGHGMEHKAGKATGATRKCELRLQMEVPSLALM
jgi:hypothetical protein